MLAIVPLLVVLDSIAKAVDVADLAFGVVGNEAGTVAGAAAANAVLLAAIDDSSIGEELIPAFATRARALKVDRVYPSMFAARVQRALDTHYGGHENGSLNTFLRANDARVHPNLNKIGMQINAENVFRPTVLDPVASFEGTGAGTGILNAGSNIDTTQHGPAHFELVVDAMGSSERQMRFTLRNFDSSTETRDVTVPADAAPGTVVQIGAAGDRYVAVNAIDPVTAGVGGTNLDRFHVRSVVERVIVL
jgi:hypothetical protein